MTTAIIAFCTLSVLLVLGKAIRLRVPLLQQLYLPGAVIGGLIGLLGFSLIAKFASAEFAQESQNVAGILRQFPGFFINVIFATLFLGKVTPKVKDVICGAFPQLCFGQIVAWGQLVLGIGLAGFALAKSFGLPPAFGNLLELGFEGGHGTVGGMQGVFSAYDWQDGLALGYTVATAGMIMGIVLGMFFINFAYKRGHVSSVRPFSERTFHERIGIYPEKDRPEAGRQTVCSDSVDSLAWHLAMVGLSVLIGFLVLKGLQGAEGALFPGAKTRLFKGFPLFPLCMLGGVVLQAIAHHLRLRLFIDRHQMQRIAGTALDFLSLSAVATIQISVVAQNWQPLVILVASGLVWTMLAVFFIGPRIFKDAWFERSITEFGQATGVTATGLLLLRTVDPENKTAAATAFGYKQLFHEPVMGVWVAIAMTLVLSDPANWFGVWLFSVGVFAVWAIFALILIFKNKKA